MIFQNIKIQKLISLFLLVAILTPFFLLTKPKQVHATLPVWDYSLNIWMGALSVPTDITAAEQTVSTATDVKSWYQTILEQILMAIARKALQEITKSTVNWINSGFHGSPLFLENPESFFQDIAKTEVKTLVDQFGYDSLKYPFGKDFALNTINAYKRQLSDNAAYSLSKVMTDPVQLRNYQNNFNVGGWDAFLINTQYPQNNYLGFQMLATEELARRVQGTTQTAAQKVQTTLQQGMGFLSPQTCPSNPDLSPQVSPYNPPSFPEAEYDRENSIAKMCPYTMEEEEHNQCVNLWKAKKTEAKREFGIANDCPGGWVNTTPGAVVSSQITNALGSQFRQSELGAAMGNSLSTIFDALLNKFIGDGLNSLASNKNSKPVEDNWSYNGLTLGSPEEGGSNSSWDSGPDEEIILDKFKKQLHGKTIVTKINPETEAEETIEEIGNTGNGTYIPGDIANTETEVILMNIMPGLISNNNKTNPGIIQLTQTLDQCIPGPDKGWEGRLKEEQQRVARKIQNDQESEDPLKIKASNETIRELKFAINAFIGWITMRMSNELPDSIIYLDTVKNIDDFPQQFKITTDQKRAKTQVLARLKAIAGDERAVVKTGLASLNTQPEPGSEQERTLIGLKKQYNSIKSSISSSYTIESARSELDTLRDSIKNIQTQIAGCKTQRVAKGWDEIGGDKSKQNGLTEMQKFCTIPIISGYSHGVVVRNDEASRLTNCPTNPGGCGRVVDGVSTFDTTGWFSFRNPNIDPTIPTRDGEFESQPADMGNPGFEDLPMVNAKNVYGDSDKVNIEIDCNLIFRANPTDYTLAGESSL